MPIKSQVDFAVRTEIGATTMSLRDTLVGELETHFESSGISFLSIVR